MKKYVFRCLYWHKCQKNFKTENRNFGHSIFLPGVLILFCIILQISNIYSQDNYFIHIGHSTVFLHLDNVNILFDPNWNDKALLIERDNPPAIPLEDMPSVDVIFISHGHFDHMDLFTLEKIHKINPDIKIFLPENPGYLLKNINITNYQELSTNETTIWKGITIKTFRANHPGSRFLFDKSQFAFCYLIKGSRTVFFSGDTGYMDLFKNIGKDEKINIAFIEIQGWRVSTEERREYFSYYRLLFNDKYAPEDIPEYLPMHLHPKQAIQVMLDLKAQKMVPIHYDAFYTKFRKIREQGDPIIQLKQNTREKGIEDRVIIEALGTKIEIE